MGKTIIDLQEEEKRSVAVYEFNCLYDKSQPGFKERVGLPKGKSWVVLPG